MKQCLSREAVFGTALLVPVGLLFVIDTFLRLVRHNQIVLGSSYPRPVLVTLLVVLPALAALINTVAGIRRRNLINLAVAGAALLWIAFLYLHDSGPCVMRFMGEPNLSQMLRCIRTS
jgi:hypothetical protein